MSLSISIIIYTIYRRQQGDITTFNPKDTSNHGTERDDGEEQPHVRHADTVVGRVHVVRQPGLKHRNGWQHLYRNMGLRKKDFIYNIL